MARNWDEIDCPKCKNDLKASALKSPHCGAEFSHEEAKARAKEHSKAMLSGCLVLLAIIAFIWWLFSGNDDAKEPVKEAKTEAVAKAPKWNKASVMQDTILCQNGEALIGLQIQKNDRQGAYEAARLAMGGCGSALNNKQYGPDQCLTMLTYGLAYYDNISASIDALADSPSSVEEIKSNKRIFTKAKEECLDALEKGLE